MRIKISGNAICDPFQKETGFIRINGTGHLENMLSTLKSLGSEQLEINGPEIQEIASMLSTIINDRENIINYKLRWHDEP